MGRKTARTIAAAAGASALLLSAAGAQATTGWTITTTPTPHRNAYDTAPRVLFAVSAVDRHDAWTAGFSNDEALLFHWNGSTWSNVTLPAPGRDPSQGQLLGLDAAAADNVWTVGQGYNVPWVAHYDGTSWTNLPTTGIGLLPDSVTALPHGHAIVGGEGGRRDNPRVAVWNGSSWTVSRLPQPTGGESAWIAAIRRIPGTRQYLIGGSINVLKSGASVSRTYTVRGRPGHWRMLKMPSYPAAYGSDLHVINGHNAWLVGTRTTTSYRAIPLLEHYNGTSWKTVKLPNVKGDASLGGIAFTSWRHGLAVGTRGDRIHHTVAFAYSAGSWRRIASPNPWKSQGFGAVTSIPGTGHYWAVGDHGKTTFAARH